MNARPKSETLFLCGDVMTGRGIDQILPHPCEPKLYEPYVRSAYEYVELAQRANGPFARVPSYTYIWGDLFSELRRTRAVLRIANLETAVTDCNEPCGGKRIHYRMHPRNVRALEAAGFDCCVLANNHALDWGRDGLAQTLTTLHGVGIRTAGAGHDLAAARAPARLLLPDERKLLVFALGMADSGIPEEWAATHHRSGVALLDRFSEEEFDELVAHIKGCRGSGDLVIVSFHWGANWGYEVTAAQRELAHVLIDRAGVDLVHGHSSHHPKPIEVYRGKLILYGCGDLLNDYEGIAGYEQFSPELGLMYFPEIDVESGELVRLSMTPTVTRCLRINRATFEEAERLCALLAPECERFGTGLDLQPDGTVSLAWQTEPQSGSLMQSRADGLGPQPP